MKISFQLLRHLTRDEPDNGTPLCYHVAAVLAARGEKEALRILDAAAQPGAWSAWSLEDWSWTALQQAIEWEPLMYLTRPMQLLLVLAPTSTRYHVGCRCGPLPLFVPARCFLAS